MNRRSTLRVQTDVPVDVYADGLRFPCRAVDVSPTGVVLERARGLEHHEGRSFYWLRIALSGGEVLAIARPAWTRGRTQAFRFVEIADSDRLTLAEHMDVATRAGAVLH